MCSYLGEKDAWTATSSRHAADYSAIPSLQKSAGALRKYKVEISFLFSFSRRTCDQLPAINDDDTNGRVMEIHVNSLRARTRVHGLEISSHEYATHARSISELYRYVKIILISFVSRRTKAFDFILVIFGDISWRP